MEKKKKEMFVRCSKGEEFFEEKKEMNHPFHMYMLIIIFSVGRRPGNRLTEKEKKEKEKTFCIN